jgi:hypothetical protein
MLFDAVYELSVGVESGQTLGVTGLVGDEEEYSGTRCVDESSSAAYSSSLGYLYS